MLINLSIEANSILPNIPHSLIIVYSASYTYLLLLCVNSTAKLHQFAQFSLI